MGQGIGTTVVGLTSTFEATHVSREVALSSGARIAAVPGALYNKERQNLVPFSVDQITTAGRVQYVAWTAADRHPMIAKRVLPHGEWETFDLSTIAGNPLSSPTEDDGHNNLSIGIDRDGYVHVAGNMHADVLRYVRSTQPHSISAWTAPGMVGDRETYVTYPQFVVTPTEFLFIYRDGVSGDSDIVINVYDHDDQEWARRSVPIVRSEAPATVKGAYINRPAVDADGVLHLFFIWRTYEGSNGGDIGHIQSDDGGTTWTLADGTPVASAVDPDNTDVVIATFAGMVNQSGADVDANGTPHAVFWGSDGSNMVARHYWWDGAAWQTQTALSLSPQGGSQNDMARASVLCHGTDTYLMYATDGGEDRRSIRLRNLSTDDLHVDFPLIEANLGPLEPTFDTRALRDRGELVVFVTNGQAELGTANAPRHLRAWGGVLTFPMENARVAAGIHDGRDLDERIWVGARDLLGWSGTPTLITRGGVPAWSMDDAVTSSASATVLVPAHWPAVNVDLWWANGAAGSGDVSFTIKASRVQAGRAVDWSAVGESSATITPTAGGDAAVVVSAGIAARPNVNFGADRVTKISVERTGGAVGDTLANAALVYGLVLSPALLA